MSNIPDNPEVGIFISQLCPDCNVPFVFSTQGGEQAFTVNPDFAVIVLDCPQCHYTLCLHIKLLPHDSQLEEEADRECAEWETEQERGEPDENADRIRRQFLAAGGSTWEWEHDRLSSMYEPDFSDRAVYDSIYGPEVPDSGEAPPDYDGPTLEDLS